jgi:Rrf2 family protein
MLISAKADHALRAVVEIAAGGERPMRSADIAAAQGISVGFLRAILGDLRRSGLVTSRSGAAGGYRLTRPPATISLAEVIRSIDGPYAEVGGVSPLDLPQPGAAEPLREVWLAVHANVRDVLEQTTVHHVATRTLPDVVTVPLTSGHTP